MKKLTTAVLCPFVVLGALAVPAHAQDEPAADQQPRRAERTYPPEFEGATKITYKTVDDYDLNLWLFEPQGDSTEKRPAIVFFYGGGWRSGSPTQFESHCRHLADRGMVAAVADYRVASRHGVKAISCVSDAHDALRYLRNHADEYSIDPDRIAAGGGSAGGHLAACLGTQAGTQFATLEGDSRPNALCLFNPAVVLAPIGDWNPIGFERVEEFNERVGDDPEKISPYHHIDEQTPPTIIFHGTADTTVVIESPERFCQKMESLGNRCELIRFEGRAHAFFNRGRGDNSDYEATLKATDEFLVSLGWLPPEG